MKTSYGCQATDSDPLLKRLKSDDKIFTRTQEDEVVPVALRMQPAPKLPELIGFLLVKSNIRFYEPNLCPLLTANWASHLTLTLALRLPVILLPSVLMTLLTRLLAAKCLSDILHCVLSFSISSLTPDCYTLTTNTHYLSLRSTLDTYPYDQHSIPILKHVLNWANCLFAEHTSDSSTNYTSFLNLTFSSQNMVGTVRRTMLRS